VYILLFLLAASYWYCLPVVTQNLVFYNEFRGYDFLLGILIVTLSLGYTRPLFTFIRQDHTARWLLRFAAWCTLTVPMTVAWSILYRQRHWPLVTLMFLFHLWGYILAYCAYQIFVRTRAQCQFLLDTFIAIGGIQAFVICLQAIHFLPLFWSERYAGYGPDAFSGTLGPNRTLAGHAMILTLAVGATYWRNATFVGTSRLLLAAVASALSLAALALTGSRTAWVVLLVFVVATVLKAKVRIWLVAFMALLMVALALAPGTLTTEISDVYEQRVTDKLSGDDLLTQFRSIDAGRFELWTGGLLQLLQTPWLIPFGGGFNSYRLSVRVGASAHNMYITLLGELGIVGLYFYMRWFRSLWQKSTDRIAASEAFARRGWRVFVPAEMHPLLMSMAVSLIAGEILYAYRPSFAFFGMFLFLCAILTHPALSVPSSGMPPQLSRTLSPPFSSGGPSSRVPSTSRSLQLR
jgi:O-antigen ligase